MAGIHSDHSKHLIVSGEEPQEGLRVYTNNLDIAVITKVAADEGCGWYCNAWHTVELTESYDGKPLSGSQIMNCERLSTRKPGGMTKLAQTINN